MTNTLDTSPEALERFGNWIAHNASHTGIDLWNDAYNALSAAHAAALVREQVANAKAMQHKARAEAAKAARDRWRAIWEKAQTHNKKLLAERDALKAENARLREALSLIAVMGYSENLEVSRRIAGLAVNQAREAVRETHALNARHQKEKNT